MTISEYRKKAAEAGYDEAPYFITGSEVSFEKFMDYSTMDSKSKIYIAKLIFRRSFYGTYMAWYKDVEWFIRNFFEEYKGERANMWEATGITLAAKKILGEDRDEQKMAIKYLFPVVENYTKYFLGFRPERYNFSDRNRHEYLKPFSPKWKNGATIGNAIEYLEEIQLPISIALKEINEHRKATLEERGIPEGIFLKYRVSKRIEVVRNPLLHGEQASFGDMGHYLLMLYILYYLHDETTLAACA